MEGDGAGWRGTAGGLREEKQWHLTRHVPSRGRGCLLISPQSEEGPRPG